MSVEDDDDDGGEEGAPAWMATFADLSTLLLTFFVLLFTFAELDAKKFELALGSLKQALGTAQGTDSMLEFEKTSPIPEMFDEPESGRPTPEQQEAMAAAMEHLEAQAKKAEVGEEVAEVLTNVLDKLGFEDQIDVESSSRGVVVKVKDQLFFELGGSDLLGKGNPVLDTIADIAKQFPAGVAIEGHTDNVPVGGSRYASNWELSAARAAAALEYMTTQKDVDQSKLRITGFAHTRPVASNDTPEGRAKNRRVEFVFLLE